MALELLACSSSPFISTPRVKSCCLVLLGEVELELLLASCACIALTQDLELGPVSSNLLRETPVHRNGSGLVAGPEIWKTTGGELDAARAGC